MFIDKYSRLIKDKGRAFQLQFMASFSLGFVERLGLQQLFPGAVTKIQHKMAALYGIQGSAECTKRFLARILSAFMLILALAVLVFIIMGDIFLFSVGVFFAITYPLLMIREVDSKIRKRRQRILLELPEMINKITLLVNAGETIQKAIIKCTENPERRVSLQQSPLLRELSQVANALSNNYSFQQAMEEFNKRCGVQEVSVFTTTVLLNYRRGGDELVLTLRELARELWEKRKALVRTIGEEASSKLVFPMVFVFLVVMVIVAAPAVMMMN